MLLVRYVFKATHLDSTAVRFLQVPAKPTTVKPAVPAKPAVTKTVGSGKPATVPEKKPAAPALPAVAKPKKVIQARITEEEEEEEDGE